MKLIVCLDNANGLSFGGRRQSRDRAVQERIRKLVGNNRLLLNTYSATLFTAEDALTVSDDFLVLAKADDFCFVENTAIPTEGVDEWYLFFWNRDYPADRYFEFDLPANGFRKVKTEQFVGSSHKKITLEVYRRG